jgi:hypothetical protein
LQGVLPSWRIAIIGARNEKHLWERSFHRFPISLVT